MEKHRNSIEFMVYGPYALFSEPYSSMSGEKFTYHIPTYEALKGIVESIYWKPTITWIIDAVRVMNPIQTETKNIRLLKFSSSKSKSDLANYTYLKDVCYQVRAHFEFNLNHPELEQDRNENKHHNIATRMVERGGRRDVFLGTRECQAFVEPCIFGEEKSFYDDLTGEIAFGFMYHSITYADEARLDNEKGKMTVNFWRPVMKQGGIIEMLHPDKCKEKRTVKDMEVTKFSKGEFSGLTEFKEEELM